VSHPLIVREAEFQAAWYFSLLLFVILLLILLGTGYALAGIRRMWRDGMRGPAAVLAGATVLSFIALIGMYATAIGGLLVIQGSGGL
jgi:hypothetical protein